MVARRDDLEGARAVLHRAKKEYPKGDQTAAVDELLARIPPESAHKEEKPARRADRRDDQQAAVDENGGDNKLQDILNRVAESAKDAGVSVQVSAKADVISPH